MPPDASPEAWRGPTTSSEHAEVADNTVARIHPRTQVPGGVNFQVPLTARPCPGRALVSGQSGAVAATHRFLWFIGS